MNRSLPGKRYNIPVVSLLVLFLVSGIVFRATPTCPIITNQFQGANGVTIDNSATGWSVDSSGLHAPHPANFFFGINSNRFTATNLGGIGIINSKVFNISGYKMYIFTDDRPGDGKLLYRLKMTGWDARLAYSNVVSILNNEGATLMELRPSIKAEGITHLYTSVTPGVSVIVTVTDATGRLQSSETVRLQKGDNYTPIDVSRLGKGIYYIHVRSVDGISKALPFIKN